MFSARFHRCEAAIEAESVFSLSQLPRLGRNQNDRTGFFEERKLKEKASGLKHVLLRRELDYGLKEAIPDHPKSLLMYYTSCSR
jgi:hypothetical protein